MLSSSFGPRPDRVNQHAVQLLDVGLLCAVLCNSCLMCVTLACYFSHTLRSTVQEHSSYQPAFWDCPFAIAR